MPELTREEKLKLIEQLPQRFQDFLYSEDTGAFLLYLGNKYKLPVEKVSALSKIVSDIILRIIPITGLAQEIANKVTSDHQIAMAITQELNSELLAPVLMPTPIAPVVPAAPPAQILPPVVEAPAVPIAPAPTPAVPAPKTDQYREPTTSEPAPTPKVGTPTSPMANVGEIIDLRKTPPPPIQMPVAAAPAYIPPPKPLTFTKPVEKVPLIEAEPHKVSPLTPTLRPSLSEVGAPTSPKASVGVEADPHRTPTPVPPEEKPQFIVRPPGLAPIPTPQVETPTPAQRGVGADRYHDVLDLRKDKGEF